MKEKTKILRKQFTIFGVGLAALFLVVGLGVWVSDTPRPARAASDKTRKLLLDYALRPSGAVPAEEIWMSRSETDIAALQRDNRELQEQVAQLRKTLTDWKDLASLRLAQAPVPPVPPTWRKKPAPTSNTDTPKPGATNPFAASRRDGAFSSAENQANSQKQTTASEHKPQKRIRFIDLRPKNKGTTKKTKRKTIKHYLPPGSIATATLLSGLDAPTGGLAQTNPVPVLMRLMNTGTLPNFGRSDLKHCHAVGAAYGDISSERAMVRLEKLSCVLMTGEVLEGELHGYVAGEDGKNGFRGNLVSKQGSIIAKALVAGLASGVSSAVSQQYRTFSTTALGTVSTLDPQRIAETGLATGASNALEKIADYYIARANETFPILEIGANRVGELVLTAGTDLEIDFIGRTRKEPLHHTAED